MPSQYKRVYPHVSPQVYERLEKCADEHNVKKPDNDDPNVSRFACDILKLFLSLDRMDGMQEFKAEDGSTTLDIIQRATYQFINKSKDDADAKKKFKDRKLN